MDTSSYKVRQDVKVFGETGNFPSGTVGKIVNIENGRVTVVFEEDGDRYHFDDDGMIAAADLIKRP